MLLKRINVTVIYLKIFRLYNVLIYAPIQRFKYRENIWL